VQAAGRRFVVRAADNRLVLYDGQERRLERVADSLQRRHEFARARTVLFRSKPRVPFVAETAVVRHRSAPTPRVDAQTGKAKHHNIAGTPLPWRWIVSEVRNDRGKPALSREGVAARWPLLTNLPGAGDAATVALGYSWRWRIESYHKRLLSPPRANPLRCDDG